MWRAAIESPQSSSRRRGAAQRGPAAIIYMCAHFELFMTIHDYLELGRGLSL